MSGAWPKPLTLGGQTFAWGTRTYVMAILNVSPDSFAGGGVALELDHLVATAAQAVRDGAAIIDIGGESTRPGATPVDAGEELRRIVPLVGRLAELAIAPISVDTSKPEVAREALRAGAGIINDIHGLRADPAMAEVVAEYGAVVIVMANKREARGDEIIDVIRSQLGASLAAARRAGIAEERVIVDPGFGFGTRPEENLAIVRRLGELRDFGHPLLLGPSRKQTIGTVLGGLPVEERLEGTAAVVALAIANGADLVRVHDVRAMVRVCRMADAVVRGWSGPAAASGQDQP